MTNGVIGQTGSVVLSDDKVKFRLNRSRTLLRYQYTKMKCCWLIWICGPFHSRMYGTCGYGTKKRVAKAALELRLANDYGYIGRLQFSDFDEADRYR